MSNVYAEYQPVAWEKKKKNVAFFIVPFPFRVTLAGSTFTLKELCSGALRGAVSAAVSEGVSLVSRGTWEQEPQPLETNFLKILC